MTRQEILFRQLAKLRQGYVRGRTLLLLVCLVCLLAFLIAAAGAADMAFRFSFVTCWMIWLALLAVLGIGLRAVIRTARGRISDESMAVLVERALPGCDNRLINAVQFARRLKDFPAFVEQLLNEPGPSLDTVSGKDLYSARPRKWFAGLLGLGVAIALVCTLVSPAGIGHSLLRVVCPMAGIAPYTQTQIASVDPGEATVLRGGNLAVQVTLRGTIPAEAVIVRERENGRTERVVLEQDPQTESTGVLRGDIKGIFHHSRYRIEAGDAQSPWYAVRVTSPPGLDKWEATVAAPAYMKRAPFRLAEDSEDPGVPAGSTVKLAGRANTELASVAVLQGDAELAKTETSGRAEFGIDFSPGENGPVRLHLVGTNGLEAHATLPFVILPDRKPTISLLDGKQRVIAERTAQVPVVFKAEDDFAVTRVGLERLSEDGEALPVTVAAPDGETAAFPGRFLLDVASFDAENGETLRFRLWAEDNGPNPSGRRGYSPVIQVTVPVPEEQRMAKKKATEDAGRNLATVVKMQRGNLKDTRRLLDLATLGREVSPDRLRDVHVVQTRIRELSAELLSQNRAVLGELATTLAGLVNHEMAEVLQVFDESYRAGNEGPAPSLVRCVRLETHILAALTGIPTGLAAEQVHQQKTDLFTLLQRIVGAQRDNLKNTRTARDTVFSAEVASALAEVEDNIANDIILFSDQCLILIEERIDDDFATQIRKVSAIVEKGRVYERALAAAEALEQGDYASGIQTQEEVLRSLVEALNLLNLWRMKNAKEIVANAEEALKKAADVLDKLEDKQARIAEVTRDLKTRGEPDEEVREKLREMDEEQKEMAALIEELANDLYQFPELPVCNELNSKMREIFEDVEQAMESENAPAVEIAVQKEDALLDAIRNTKERVEDVEMWLPDIPDNIVWNMESFDTDEFPEIPLVPLPDELEDIVGDLLDQASDIDAQSQDTTGNNIIADMEMGWGVMDGPMPSFSAKGKSGNTRPNDNEMTGRSGAGREGQATGELVENHVKGLEGRTTHARRTQDPFQKGMVTEDENSKLDARSTGGGKLGGESESIGMFGKAPRRDLHTGAHGGTPAELRRETEALYATARLLYLGTGSLGTAARELRGVEAAGDKMKDFGSLHRRVMRRLEDTQVELNSGVVLPMPVASVSKTGGAATDDLDVSKISEEYRDIVSDYYRSIETE